jgi:hypothetical protein
MIQGSGLRVDHGVSAEFAAVGPGSSFPIAVAECLSLLSAPFFSSPTASVCPSLETQRRPPASDELDLAIPTLALPALAAPATPVVSPSARGGGRGDLAAGPLREPRALLGRVAAAPGDTPVSASRELDRVVRPPMHVPARPRPRRDALDVLPVGSHPGCLGPDAACHRVRRRRPVRVPDTWVPPEPVTVPLIQIDLGALRRYHTHDSLSEVRGSETRTAKEDHELGGREDGWRWTRSAG